MHAGCVLARALMRIAMLLRLVKPILPDVVVSVLRAANWKRSTSLFRSRVVRHDYVDVPLKISISDPIGAEWYDKACPDLEELRTLLGFAALGQGQKAFVLGAHQCVVSLVLARTVGNAGRVAALEGARFNVEVGRKNIALNKADNLELLHAVVGATDGEAQFVSVGNGYLGRGKKEVTERVPSVSVDTLAARLGDPDFVFMDIEGVEYSALEKSDLLRRRNTIWAIEAHGDADMAHYGGSNRDLVALFRRWGYEIFVFDRVSRYEKLAEDVAVTAARMHLCCKPKRHDGSPPADRAVSP